jgi:hypothetical protein
LDPTYEAGSSKLIRGTPHTHPKYCLPTNEVSCAPNIPEYPLYDVGVIVLDEPVSMATYGALPEAGVVDALDEGQRLSVIGYGVRSGFDPSSGDRYRATVRLLNTNNAALGDMFVKTSGVTIGGGGEGSCNGDSGGPLLLPDRETIMGVTSFGTVPLCRGPGYYQRVDLPQVLSWVRSFF